MRMRMALALVAVLALASGVSACGGSGGGSGPIGGTVATPTTTTPAGGGDGAGGRRAAAQECAAAGITTPPYNEGTCVQDGNRLVVANGRSLLTLRTLKASLRGFTVVEGMSGPNGRITPQGAFLIVRLGIENTTRKPAHFAAGQTLLLVNGQQIEERTDVEQDAHPEALAHNGRGALQPGRLVEGSVVYDIPIEMIERVTSEGNLLVANFGGNPRGRQPEFGQFRIYAQ